MRCILCGGDHVPHPRVCDPTGIEQNKMDPQQWNRITAMVQRETNKGALEEGEISGMLYRRSKGDWD